MPGQDTLRPRSRRRLVVRAAAVLLWLAMMGWLVVSEAFPHLFVSTLPGYRSILRDTLSADSWMAVTVQGEPAGYSHSSLETSENEAAAFTRLRNETRLVLNLAGSIQALTLELEVALDPWHRMTRFEFSVLSAAGAMRAAGERLEGDTFHVSLSTPASVHRQDIRIPDTVVLDDLLVESALRELRPGSSVRLDAFDPLSLRVQPMTIKALRREPVTVHGTNVPATVLSASFLGQESLAWVDASGRALRAETPFGWRLEACDVNTAFATLRAAREAQGSVDLAAALAVHCEPPVPDPPGPRLRYRLLGVDLDPTTLASNRQHPSGGGKSGPVVLEVLAAVTPGPDVAVPPPPPEALADTATLQCANPEVRALARRITRDAPTPLAKAEAIHAWVAANIRKTITLSVPTALDVLRTRRGDCNEHAILAVALARAAGVPAVTKAGLVWSRNAFYYHAWPAFFVGDWVETDPTLGYDRVGPAHIAFAEGDLADHTGVVRIMGRLRLERIPDP